MHLSRPSGVKFRLYSAVQSTGRRKSHPHLRRLARATTQRRRLLASSGGGDDANPRRICVVSAERRRKLNSGKNGGAAVNSSSAKRSCPAKLPRTAGADANCDSPDTPSHKAGRHDVELVESQFRGL